MLLKIQHAGFILLISNQMLKILLYKAKLMKKVTNIFILPGLSPRVVPSVLEWTTTLAFFLGKAKQIMLYIFSYSLHIYIKSTSGNTSYQKSLNIGIIWDTVLLCYGPFGPESFMAHGRLWQALDPKCFGWFDTLD